MSFVTEILQSAEHSKNDDFNAKITKLADEIANAKVDVHRTMVKRYVNFSPIFGETLELTKRVSKLKSSSQAQMELIATDIQMKLNSTSDDYRELRFKLEELNTVLLVVDKICAIHQNFESYHIAIDECNFQKAAIYISSIDDIYRSFDEQSIREEDVVVLKTLRSEYSMARMELIEIIDARWNEHVVWTLTNYNERSAFYENVTLKMIKPRQETVMKVNSIFEAMHTLNELDRKVTQFARSFSKHVLNVIFFQKTVVSLSETRDLEIRVSTEPRDPNIISANLKAIFDFLFQSLFGLKIKGRSLMDRLGDQLALVFVTSLVDDFLEPCVPATQQEMDGEYSVLLDEVKKVVGFLLDIGFLTTGACETLQNYAKNAETLFAKKMCLQIIVKARQLMKKDLHITADAKVGDGKLKESLPDVFGSIASVECADATAVAEKKIAAELHPFGAGENALSSDLFRFPKCKISESTEDIVRLIYRSMYDATQSTNEIYASKLIFSARNIVELYMAVVPVYHKENLTNLPEQSALAHNNCMYIAHHLMTIGFQYKLHLPAPLNERHITLVDLIPDLRRCGSDIFLEQMKRQRKILLDIINGVGDFLTMSSDPGFLQSLDRGLRQCFCQLQLLKRVWSETLPLIVYCRSIGTLLNTLVEELATRILSLEDIPANSAAHLVSILEKVVENGAKLFKVEGSTVGDKFCDMYENVPRLLCFKELIIVLGASMKDISDRWADGKGPLANELSVDQVKKLIKALFQNTDMRASVLAKLK